MLLGVDVGGTFTDAVVLDGERLHTAKAPTTPDDQSEGVIAAVEAALARAGAAAEDVESFAHGMTVGTNALLTESGARTALIATEGFTDLLDVARQNRPRLYHLCAGKPAPLVADELRLGVRERTGAEGVLETLRDEEAERIAALVEDAAPESVAVCLLFSYRDPSHEKALARVLRERLPGLHLSVSHEVLPRFREYERCSTTVIDAYLSPLLARYLEQLADAALQRGLPEPAVMKSSGGIAPLAEASASGSQTVLSGPAGGAVGATLLARLAGEPGAIGLDMGGTSCDVCVVGEDGVRHTDSREIGGRVIQLPMVDVHTVGAGGGSVGWRDAGGALRVGPRSAGADPGPACYGRGGSEPTVTDANLLLGLLSADAPLAGGVELDAEAARDAIGALGAQLGLGELETAEGIVRVANQEMTRALRVVTVERGVDPRELALIPFGGAGPLHAAALAEELGIGRILCPAAGGVLSALGLVASERRRDTARTVMLLGDELTAERVAEEVAALRESIAAGLADAEARVTYELRYRGQAFELEVEGPERPDPADLAERFAAEHERRYGHRDPEGEVELVTIRLALVVPGPDPVPRAPQASAAETSVRRVRMGGAWDEAEILRGEPATGARGRGPAVFELPDATFALPAGWRYEVDAHGTIAADAVGR